MKEGYNPAITDLENGGGVETIPLSGVRLDHLVNVIHSGAKTLTVLAMEPPDGVALSHYSLSRKLADMAGGKVVEKASIRGYVTNDFIPLGIAQQGAQEGGNHWTLTDEGEGLKPALLWMWSKMLDQQMSPGSIFGSIYAGKKRGGEMVLSTPMARVSIMSQLAAARGPLRIVDFSTSLHHTAPKATQIIDSLVYAGLVTKENAVGGYGEDFAVFKPAESGTNTEYWGNLIDAKQANVIGPATTLRQAIRDLIQKGEIITETTVKPYFERISPYNGRQINDMLRQYEKKGYLIGSKWHKGYFSEVNLTSEGVRIFSEVIQPMIAWSKNPETAQEIDPEQHGDLHRRIADSFRSTSPYKNPDYRGKQTVVMEYIKQYPGETRAEVARALSLPLATVYDLILPLVENGSVKTSYESNGRIELEA